jgi:hypothetical protein
LESLISFKRKKIIELDDSSDQEGDGSSQESKRYISKKVGVPNLNNHLPDNFYSEKPCTLTKLVLIGFYTVDGRNRRTTTVSRGAKKDVDILIVSTGFGLKSTDSPFLYKLLIDCGVPIPLLSQVFNVVRYSMMLINVSF